ncbi:hypothetical protein BT96DRAFT_822622 [Gymnopus androsaceus JB14]|uniref:YDG domain-containing protein n=1 Tax=Gymnopus androsaceus JB14 TaxID=1447944 RepID=A0A6A4HIX1_9AGAR|nr:hypothetical protein BT96DRAFT_822622 [Gymnopus androsaceus JB14]
MNSTPTLSKLIKQRRTFPKDSSLAPLTPQGKSFPRSTRLCTNNNPWYRKALSEAGVHAHTYAGISGTKAGGGKSVVLSGGYKDDQDMGNVILYTGTGGQRNSFSQPGPQIEDQSFDHPMNGYLKKSFETQIPIRVIRGPSDSCFSPAQGYRYDGLYKVTEVRTKGEHGFAVCRFRLERLPGQPPIKKRSTW